MRVVITGGTGLIGSALAESLSRDGHDVVVLSRDPGRQPRFALPAGVRVAAWDARTSDGWLDLADGADAIVNLAGASLSEGRWTDDRKRVIRSSRVNAGRAVVDAVEKAARKPAVVIQASGINYYGTGDEPVTESSPPGDDFLAGVCVDWEGSTAPVEALGVRRVIIRGAVVLSQRGGALPRMVMPYRFFVGGPLGSGKQWFPWIHLADEVSAIRFLIGQETARGPYNLCAPELITNRELSQAIGRALRRPSVMPVPAIALRIMFGEMATVLLEGQRAVPERLQQAGFTFRYPDIQSALNAELAR